VSQLSIPSQILLWPWRLWGLPATKYCQKKKDRQKYLFLRVHRHNKPTQTHYNLSK
jgi:hypothetical protein